MTVGAVLKLDKPNSNLKFPLKPHVASFLPPEQYLIF
jgi:hypothetical protein